MARTEAVWGIDIGNCSLKALRCRLDDRPDRIVAEAFDYIEYPKILTQPGAEPEELLSEALTQFLSRNNVRGDRVAIAVSGQSGLARFIKLPPVEAKRVPDIVKYEAKQQIPFDLDDVIWDYQRMGGGIEEEGFVLEAEVGLFAMKRDQVFRALEPFRKAGIEVDFVQLTPLALYNFFAFDQMPDLPPPDEYDADSPPPSYVLLSMGTDATDLVVTNGYRVWQRSVPLGGNHFTKALTKELKLTFAKAEHLKRNAASAQDPKAVFQAMRPVFNDLLTEIQRSITYFTSINRTANIARLVPLGNAIKLPGLRRYLSQSLGYEVAPTDGFRGLAGPEVVKAPAFRENRLSFGTCYGLAIQALGKSSLTTNLLPGEILKDRVIRGKKPWALAAAAVLLLGFAIYFVGFARAMGRMGNEEQGPYKDAENQVSSVVNESSRLKQEADAYMAEFKAMDEIGKNLLKSVEGRVQWLELLKAINSCLPTDLAALRQKHDPDQKQDELQLTEGQIMAQDRLYISNLEVRYTENLEQWFAGVGRFYQPAPGEPMPKITPAAPGSNAFGSPGGPGDTVPPGWKVPETDSSSGGASSGNGPSGPGWIIALTGYHYHNPNEPGKLMGAEYVKRKLLDKLRDPSTTVMLPKKDDPSKLEKVSLKDLRIGYPVLLPSGRVKWVTVVNPYAKRPTPGSANASEEGYPGYASAPMPGTMPGSVAYGPRGAARAEGAVLKLGRFDFLVQFCVSEPEEKGNQPEQQSGTAP